MCFTVRGKDAYRYLCCRVLFLQLVINPGVKSFGICNIFEHDLAFVQIAFPESINIRNVINDVNLYQINKIPTV